MGREYWVICSKCGEHFPVREGGGFFFHLLHCSKCGKEKSVGFDKLNKAGIAICFQDDLIENYVGKCDCGGKFKFSSKSRCPKCHSSKYMEDPKGMMVTFYD
jgi:DNA-directed RNA polymerase subunit M/transcription elongation factor TFIIS